MSFDNISSLCTEILPDLIGLSDCNRDWKTGHKAVAVSSGSSTGRQHIPVKWTINKEDKGKSWKKKVQPKLLWRTKSKVVDEISQWIELNLETYCILIVKLSCVCDTISLVAVLFMLVQFILNQKLVLCSVAVVRRNTRVYLRLIYGSHWYIYFLSLPLLSPRG